MIFLRHRKCEFVPFDILSLVTAKYKFNADMSPCHICYIHHIASLLVMELSLLEHCMSCYLLVPCPINSNQSKRQEQGSRKWFYSSQRDLGWSIGQISSRKISCLTCFSGLSLPIVQWTKIFHLLVPNICWKLPSFFLFDLKFPIKTYKISSQECPLPPNSAIFLEVALQWFRLPWTRDWL